MSVWRVVRSTSIDNIQVMISTPPDQTYFGTIEGRDDLKAQIIKAFHLEDVL
jgi:hypothetical protein